MSHESDESLLEAKICSIIRGNDTANRLTFDKIDKRLERHWTRMGEISAVLCSLRESFDELESRVTVLEKTKLDVLDEREVRSRTERAEIFDQVQLDAESKIIGGYDKEGVGELNARLELLIDRVHELERVVRTHLR